jgi:hypothetical protein
VGTAQGDIDSNRIGWPRAKVIQIVFAHDAAAAKDDAIRRVIHMLGIDNIVIKKKLIEDHPKRFIACISLVIPANHIYKHRAL